MQILNSNKSKITIKMDENEKTVDMIGGNKVETIIIEEGAESIANEAFRLCPNLKKLYLLKKIKYIGDRIFKSDYSEVQIYYDGSTEEFMKIDFEREVYIPSKYDRYPYYSDYGASSEYQRFYRRYDAVLMWCEVICNKDKKILTFGEKSNC